MAERKEEEALHSRIVAIFRKSSVKGHVMLSIPEVAEALGVDRRKAETPLALLSKGRNPKLVEITKSRTKYYVLKEIFDFCQKFDEGKE
jgi:hypothetical protein